MPFVRIYEQFEVRQLLQSVEGVRSPVTGKEAHSRDLHAKSVLGSGGTQDNRMLHRTHRSPGESASSYSRRGQPITSAFANLVQQGSATCDALNSPAGKAALAVFDDAKHVGKKLRMTLTVPVTREMGFLPGSGAPSLHVSTQDSPVVDKSQNTAVIRLIIDRAPNSQRMHIQTAIPMGGPAPAASWSIVEKPSNTAVASG